MVIRALRSMFRATGWNAKGFFPHTLLKIAGYLTATPPTMSATRESLC